MITLTSRRPNFHLAAEVAYEDGNALRAAIADARERDILRTVTFDRSGWATCGGCRQSATSSYLGRQCCTRCGLVLT